MTAGGISVHAVDVARGRVAEGLSVRIERIAPDGGRVLVAQGHIGPTGALDHPVAQGAGVQAGEHEVLLEIGAWLRATGSEAPPFLDIVPFRFRVFDVAQHYHLPIKFTPFGYSLYRGA
ncbi:hydroxyisourate hydrolase [Falsiroseomonas oryzae]|uniref:hydroxyisourate hydrolase n=1 Tax=Falsiroseomonas oryzae TaxID=2766473 RepID=UPI0022EB794F|nr:hydroxyisourate hydrolase [Roseomonas sp. MO-31]